MPCCVLFYGGNIDVDIAILDTGIDADHPDLNVHEALDFTEFGSAEDGHGHGTHVAGTTAAIDNNDQVVGVAPGARIWSLKVLDNNGFGNLSDIIAAVDYVTQHADQVDVVNLSLGASGSDDGNCGRTSV